MQISFTVSDYNGTNVSCFGSKDGSVTVHVTGGTPPYTYLWSNDATTATITGCSADYYGITVTDSTNTMAEDGINLISPAILKPILSAYEYNNGYNISLYGASNGSITTTIDGGVSPFTFEWEDGPATQNRTMLGGGFYNLTVTDANNCLVSAQTTLSEPERDDWTMNGNPNSNPATQFIGTTDAKDFVVKTNGAERMRIKSDGVISMSASTHFDKLLVHRISSPDSLIYIGDSTIIFQGNANRFWGDPYGTIFRGISMGAASFAYGQFSSVIGHFSRAGVIGGAVGANADESVLIGSGLNAGANAVRSIVIGSGITGGASMTYNLPHSIAMGINSNIPTVVVTQANGAGTTGNIGIGTGTTIPINKTDINGAVAIGTYAGVNTAPPNGLIISGNTGIGNTNPIAKLHIESLGTTNATRSLLVQSALGGGTKLFEIFDNGHLEVNQPQVPLPSQFALESAFQYGIDFRTHSSDAWGVFGGYIAAQNTGTGSAFGVNGASYFSTTNINQTSIGVCGFSASSGFPPGGNKGVFGMSLGIPSVPAFRPTYSIGVLGAACDGISYNYGGVFNAGSPGFTDYADYYRGVQAIAGDGNFSNIGVAAYTWNFNSNFPLTGTDYGLYTQILNPNTVSNVNWSAWINGMGYITNGPWQPSDTTFKQNVDTFSNAMNIISQLIPRKYEFKIEEYPDMNFPTGLQYGFAAQEIEEVLPNLVTDARKPADVDTQGNVINPARTFKAYKEGSLIPIIVQALKESSHKIDSLQTVIDTLYSQVNPPGGGERRVNQSNETNGNWESKNKTYIELSSKDVILYQNIPNPFGNETSINYYLPENIANAKIVFFDEYGRSINETELKDKGNGSIIINSANLAKGIYSYSIIVNGNVKDTKKMIRTK